MKFAETMRSNLDNKNEKKLERHKIEQEYQKEQVAKLFEDVKEFCSLRPHEYDRREYFKDNIFKVRLPFTDPKGQDKVIEFHVARDKRKIYYKTGAYELEKMGWVGDADKTDNDQNDPDTLAGRFHISDLTAKSILKIRSLMRNLIEQEYEENESTNKPEAEISELISSIGENEKEQKTEQTE